MFTLEIQTDNAAFHRDDPELDRWATVFQIKSIMYEAHRSMMDGANFGACFDVNGNKVGTWVLME